MKIYSFVKNSFVDYPHQIASVIFTCGCNFNCWYCQNWELILANQKVVDENEVFDFLSKRRGMIDAVVISGGEPTLQNDLIDFAQKIKNMGFLLKLDTNGSNPEVIKKCLELKLFDYYAMDIKALPSNYTKFSLDKTIVKKIEISIELIKQFAPDYEFRTTFEPDLSVDEIEKIAELLGKNCKKYFLQQYRPTTQKTQIIKMPHQIEQLNLALNVAKKYIDNVSIRNL